MNRITLRTLSSTLITTLPLAVAAVFSSTSASAQTLATPTTQALRTDVRAACPGIDAALQDSLAHTWLLTQQPSMVRVLMQVEGRRVVGVSTVGGNFRYSNPIKRAVAQLACDAGGGGRQQFSFEVRFAHEDDLVTADNAGPVGS